VSILSGNNQASPANQALPNPIVALVTDFSGNPVSGVTVTFAVTAGGGSLSGIQSVTDAQGQASATWTLGQNIGPNTVTATAAGLLGSPVTIAATATGTVHPDVTINQAAGQADPTGTSPINFTVVFSEAVSGFLNTGVTLGGTAGATTAAVTGSGTTYNVAVSGMTVSGTVIASVLASAATGTGSLLGNSASTSADNTVSFTAANPTVTINQAAGQTDPTGVSPINFTVVFSEAVTGFSNLGVSIAGTAPGTKTVIVTGSGTTYNVAVGGMTGAGTVIATVNPSAAIGIASGLVNISSTSTDNSVAFAPAVKKVRGQLLGE
jgi:hypothetical protein